MEAVVRAPAAASTNPQSSFGVFPSAVYWITYRSMLTPRQVSGGFQLRRTEEDCWVAALTVRFTGELCGADSLVLWPTGRLQGLSLGPLNVLTANVYLVLGIKPRSVTLRWMVLR
jgi:hypothetical protein